MTAPEVRLIPRREPIPPCLDGGWAAHDLVFDERDLLALTDVERGQLQAWLDHGTAPGITVYREEGPIGPRLRWGVCFRVTSRPSITTLPA